MKLKAILKDRKITFIKPVWLKADEMEIEIDVPDEMVEVINEERLKSMNLDELIEFIWGDVEVSEENLAHLNKDYRELLMDALTERYKA